MFGDDIIIENLEVELVDLQNEAVHNGVVGCNEILSLIGIEGGNKYFFGFTMLGGQNISITVVISDI